jgi:hypothetical protein
MYAPWGGHREQHYSVVWIRPTKYCGSLKRNSEGGNSIAIQSSSKSVFSCLQDEWLWGSVKTLRGVGAGTVLCRNNACKVWCSDSGVAEDWSLLGCNVVSLCE